MKHKEDIMAEKASKLSSSKSKKSTKRKRKSSKREPDDDPTSNTLAEDKHNEKENGISSVPDSFIVFDGAESKDLSKSNPTSKQKKPVGITKSSYFMKTKSSVGESEKSVRVRKKKTKRKTKKSCDTQDLETETEDCFKVNGVQAQVTSQTKSKKDIASVIHTHKFDSNFSGSSLEDSSVCGSKFNVNNDNTSKKDLPLKDKSKNLNRGSKRSTNKVRNADAPFYQQTRPQQKFKFTSNEKKEFVFQKKEKAKALELNMKKKLVSYPADKFIIDRDRFIVLLFPGQSLYLHGLLSIRPLVGKVTILGYRLEELEQQNIYSFNSHALLSVKAIEGSKISVSQHSHLLDYGLQREQLQNIEMEQTEPVVVVELQKCNHPIARKLSIIGQEQLMIPQRQKGGERAWEMLITQDNCHKYHLTEETAEWKETMENISLYFECGNEPRVILCGGKGVGKSTLFRYVVNGLLSKKGTRVQCLDFDPGQTELSLPACVSLTLVTEPLLGPPYTHHAEASSPYVKQIMIGSVNPQFGLQRYIKAVKQLFELSKAQADCPLVVNTMGWTVGTGLDLILDTIRIVQPTHVIQIQGGNRKNNYDIVLNPSVVQHTLGGVVTKPRENDLHYSLMEINSLSGRKDKVTTFTPKLLRELAVSLHLSDAVSDFLESNKGDQEETHNIVIVQWPEVALHVCGTAVPKQRILQVLNGSLIAMCHVDSHKVASVSPDLPKHLMDDLDFGQCIGWGVVRGIDPLTKELHILTTVPSDKVSSQVNAIIKPELHLPDRFYAFFTKGEGPYYHTMYRFGAGRLKVDRQIKPHMAKLGHQNKNE